MSRMFDHKRAASGERDEMDEEVALEPIYRPTKPFEKARTTQRSDSQEKPFKRPVTKASDFNRNHGRAALNAMPLPDQPVDERNFLISDQGFEQFKSRIALHRHYGRTVPAMYGGDREIVMEVGRNVPGGGTMLATGFADATLLVRAPIETPIVPYEGSQDNWFFMERLDPAVYRGVLNRQALIDSNDKPFAGIMLEVGFHSRNVDGTDSIYMGKIKQFFPAGYRSVAVYLDFTKM